jgi:Tol biopolymer transport system component
MPQSRYSRRLAGLLALIGLLALTLVAGQQARGAAANSSRHSKILFDRLVDPSTNNYEIFTMNPDGSDQRNLTKNAADDWGASASPNGKRIVFTSQRDADANDEIFIMRSDGSHPRQLTHTGAAVTNEYPSFSPDGKRIVYDSSASGDSDVYVMRVDGSHQHPLTETFDNDYAPVFSPNGKTIAFSRGPGGGAPDQIYAMNTRGRHVHALTKNAPPVSNDTPQYFPNGTKIAFESFRDAQERVVTMNADGSHQHSLTDAGSRSLMPSVAPSGNRLVFVSNRTGTDEHVFKMRPDGTQARPLTSGKFFEEFPRYARLSLP